MLRCGLSNIKLYYHPQSITIAAALNITAQPRLVWSLRTSPQLRKFYADIEMSSSASDAMMILLNCNLLLSNFGPTLHPITVIKSVNSLFPLGPTIWSKLNRMTFADNCLHMIRKIMQFSEYRKYSWTSPCLHGSWDYIFVLILLPYQNFTLTASGFHWLEPLLYSLHEHGISPML